MTNKLTLDQLKMMEKLTGKEYTLYGKPKKHPRKPMERWKLGLPVSFIKHYYELPYLEDEGIGLMMYNIGFDFDTPLPTTHDIVNFKLHLMMIDTMQDEIGRNVSMFDLKFKIFLHDNDIQDIFIDNQGNYEVIKKHL